MPGRIGVLEMVGTFGAEGYEAAKDVLGMAGAGFGSVSKKCPLGLCRGFEGCSVN